MRILLDTNVIISALFFGGKPRTILQSVVKKEHVAVTTPVLLSELTDVLRKKFGYSKEAATAVDRRIRKQSEIVFPREMIDVFTDTPDNRVLEGAAEGKCDVIITGDVGLLTLKKYRTIKILSPEEFLRVTKQ